MDRPCRPKTNAPRVPANCFAVSMEKQPAEWLCVDQLNKQKNITLLVFQFQEQTTGKTPISLLWRIDLFDFPSDFTDGFFSMWHCQLISCAYSLPSLFSKWMVIWRWFVCRLSIKRLSFRRNSRESTHARAVLLLSCRNVLNYERKSRSLLH